MRFDIDINTLYLNNDFNTLYLDNNIIRKIKQLLNNNWILY